MSSIEKYKDKSKTELAEDLARRDNRKKVERMKERQDGAKLVRLGTTLALSLGTGVLYTVAPKAEKFVGPVGGDAVLALAGGLGAVMTDGLTADILEGAGATGLAGAGRDMGRYLAGLFGGP